MSDCRKLISGDVFPLDHAIWREMGKIRAALAQAAYIVRAILQIRSAASACPEPRCHGCFDATGGEGWGTLQFEIDGFFGWIF